MTLDMTPKRETECNCQNCPLPLQGRRAEEAVTVAAIRVLGIHLGGTATVRPGTDGSAAAYAPVVVKRALPRPARLHHGIGRDASRPVKALFPAVAIKVVQPERVWQLFPHAMEQAACIVRAPGIVGQLIGFRAIEEDRAGARAAGKLPLRPRRERGPLAQGARRPQRARLTAQVSS